MGYEKKKIQYIYPPNYYTSCTSKLLTEVQSDLFPEINGVNRTMKRSGQHMWEMSEFLFESFRHFPSLDHSSAASCRKTQQREEFPPVFEKSYPHRVSAWMKTRHPAGVNKGCTTYSIGRRWWWGLLCKQQAQGPSPG